MKALTARVHRPSWRALAALLAAIAIVATGLVLRATGTIATTASHHSTNGVHLAAAEISDAQTGADAANSHDANITGPGGVRDNLPTLVATPTTPAPFRQEIGTAATNGTSFCFVGTVMVQCTASNPTNPAPEYYISAVVKYAAQAGVDPRLMLTMLWNEQQHWHAPGGDTANGWWDSLPLVGNPDGPSYGMADMKKEPFYQVHDSHSSLFGSHQWTDLQTNNDLAIQMLAYQLADEKGLRTADQSDQDWAITQTIDNHMHLVIPATWKDTSIKRDEMLAMAANVGARTAADIANGTPATEKIKEKGTWYKSSIGQQWARADQIICQSGAFTCSL
ncbi:hypothetical protein [Streptomyces sp. NPDC020298]|uniref:hypothetical protein n=1 Tax=unclassified Streptomyces TaxID=2593676 RepID=UPI0033FAB7A4